MPNYATIKSSTLRTICRQRPVRSVRPLTQLESHEQRHGTSAGIEGRFLQCLSEGGLRRRFIHSPAATVALLRRLP